MAPESQSHDKPNHLISEKSPYLLQHAHNPVDWYPWGEEAFALAKELDKPIFLSIGYATCHWCHVMEKESFENADVAKLMNDAFVNIKVDREELPEVDTIYMEFAQALMSTAGGWPLNVILTPELKPFFAVTYLPPKTNLDMIGLDQFIPHINQLWESEERPYIIDQANRIVEIFERAAHTRGEELPLQDHVHIAVEQLFELADPVYGGIKGEPKFPLSYQANFLLSYGKQKNESRAIFYVELTLDMMARGGIYDHLGGGFSRYSVDEKWLVPHFEKMLYDNALLVMAYLDGWKVLKKNLYRDVCTETCNYILRDMTSPDGGFYSAEDADSEGREGLFYTWTEKEIKEALDPKEADLFCEFFGVEKEGIFEGRNVLHYEMSLEEFADQKNVSEVELDKRLSQAKAALFKKREERPRPFKDDKILSGWNGLMIGALVKAGKAFGEERFTAAAVKAAEFLKKTLWKEGRLLRRFREGESRFHASLPEYAYVISGLLSLYEEGCGKQWLDWAMELAGILEHDFKIKGGAFYQTDGKENLIIRKCEFYDGAEPSGNAVHCENLLRLYQITENEIYLKQAEDILKSAKELIETYPPGACYSLMALQEYLNLKARKES